MMILFFLVSDGLYLSLQKVNVGTSGAEIGAAFGGNKVSYQVAIANPAF